MKVSHGEPKPPKQCLNRDHRLTELISEYCEKKISLNEGCLAQEKPSPLSISFFQENKQINK